MADYLVSGAGTADYNGTYTFVSAGVWQKDGSHFLSPDGNNNYALGAAAWQGFAENYYYGDGVYPGDTPDTGSWYLVNGAAPAPTVTLVSSDTTAPTLSSASISGTTLTINWTEANSVTGTTGLSLSNLTPAVTLSSVSTTGTTTTATVSRALYVGEVPKLNYTPGNFQDNSANAVAAFSNQAVTNSSTTKKPVKPLVLKPSGQPGLVNTTNEALDSAALPDNISADKIADGTTNKAYTATEKTKLTGIASGANNYTHPNHTGDVTSTGDGATTIANNAVTDAKLRDSAALSVIGRSANSTGDPADIAAGTDGHVLRRSGTTVGFGTVATTGIADSAVTDAKLRAGAGLSVIGRASSTTGTVTDIVATANGQVLVRPSSSGIGWALLTDASMDSANKDGTAGTASLRTLGTGAQQAAAGNHAHAFSALTGAATVAQLPIDSLLPWTVDINVFHAGITQTNFSTITMAATDAVYNAVKSSTGAQNAEIGWDIVLAAGTWTFELLHTKFTARGIYTVSLDGSSVGTIDGYNASAAWNALDTITGITVATTGKKRLLLKMATKNASASDYTGTIQHIQLRRTA